MRNGQLKPGYNVLTFCDIKNEAICLRANCLGGILPMGLLDYSFASCSTSVPPAAMNALTNIPNSSNGRSPVIKAI